MKNPVIVSVPPGWRERLRRPQVDAGAESRSDDGLEDDLPRAVDELGHDDHVVAAGVAGAG